MSSNPGDFQTTPPEFAGPAEPPVRRPKKGLIWLLSVILVVLLAGAGVGTALLMRSLAAQNEQTSNEQTTGSGPSEDEDEGGDAEESREADEQVTPPTGPLVIPACETLNPAAQEATDHLLGLGAELTPPPGEVGVAEFDAQFGPVARTTMAASEQMRGCYYVLSMHDALSQFVAEIEPSETATLLEALRAEPLFTESSSGDATFFVSTHTEESEIGTFTQSVGHAFLGKAWVSYSGSGDATPSLTTALEAMRAANPGLRAG